MRRELQLAKYHLKKWAFLEKCFLQLEDYEKAQASRLFKSLEKISEGDLEVIAERYYFSNRFACYRPEIDQFSSVIPMSYKSVANKLNITTEEVQERLRQIEMRLGCYIKVQLEDDTKEHKQEYLSWLQEYK